MKRQSIKASAISLAATILTTLLATSGSSAAAENTLVSSFSGESAAAIPAAAPLDPAAAAGNAATAAYAVLPPVHAPLSAPAAASPTTDTPPAIAASSLEQLVASRSAGPELSGELKCLAGAIYFEARSETLEGQLAVGRVVIARTKSGRFPASYCGVVYQPAQFSFVRGQTMPSVDAHSPLWQKAVAMARIADAGSWQSSAEGALYFHAARVGTNWRVKRIAQIDHHVFYR